MVAGVVSARRTLQISSDQPVVFFLQGPGAYQVHADSNGCAAGNTFEEAIVQGFLELVERDAYAIWWYNRLQRAQLDLGQFDDPYVRDLKIQLAETGRRLWVLDVTSDLGIPTFVTIAHWTENSQEFVEFGSGAHFDARIAAAARDDRAQSISVHRPHGRPERASSTANRANRSAIDSCPFRLQDHPYLTPSGDPAVRPDFGSKFGHLDKREQVTACVSLAKRAGPRFPGSRSDAPRHRGPGRQGDRSGIAAFLSPLRAWPALRCPGQARMARPAAAGKRAQSASSPDLRGVRLARSRNKARATGWRRRTVVRPARRSRRARSARGRKHRRLLRWPFGRPGKVQRRRGGSRAGPAHGSAARLVCVRRRGASTRKFICWSGDWPGTVCWSTASGARATARTTGRHRAAGSRLLAANAAARQCRRSRPVAVRVHAAARQRDGSGIAARRRAVQDLRSEDRGRHGHAVHAATDRTAPPAGRFSGNRASRPAGGLPDPVQDRRLPATAACGRPRATTTSFFGTFTISCSTRAARKAGTPTRWAEFIHMPASWLRCRRCGRAGPERKSICASSRPRIRRQSRRPRSFCVNVIRRAVFDDQRPITLAELSRFLDGTARVQSTWRSRLDLGDDGPVVEYAVQAVSVGRRQLRARALSGRRQMRRAGARILSLRRRRARAGADRRRARMSSTRCWREPNSRWARPPRPRS